MGRAGGVGWVREYFVEADEDGVRHWKMYVFEYVCHMRACIGICVC